MMRWFDRLRLRFRSLLWRERVERELDQELSFHIDELTRQQIERGVPAGEARAAALRQFGGVAQLQEACRDQRRMRWIEDSVHDLRYAIRLFAKSPGFTAVALLSLALGIGANTAVFSLLETIALRKLPVHEPGGLVQIVGTDGKGTQGSFSYPSYQWFRENGHMFSHVFTWRFTHVWAGQGDSISVDKVSEDYFAGLGASALLGRTLGDESSQPAVAVLSHKWWNGRFQADPGIVGRELRLGGIRFTIAGVMPEGFSGTEVGKAADVYIPLAAERLLAPYSDLMSRRNAAWLPLMGRLRNDVTRQQATAGFQPVWRSMVEEAGPANSSRKNAFSNFKGELRPAASGISGLRREFDKPLKILFVVVGVVLLIACVNLANLLLARALTRQREIALRVAVGASRGRLFRQLLTESLLLAFGGAALGLLFAQWSSRLFVALLSSSEDAITLDIRLNSSVLLYTAALAVFTTLLFGLAPVMRTLRSSLQPALKEGSRQVTSSQTWSRSLLVVQVALSLLLTFGAALFLRTFSNLVSVNPGFDAGRVLVAEVQPIRVGIKEEAAKRFYRDLTARLALLPGVEVVSSSDATPIQGCCWWDPIEVEGYTPAPGENMKTFFDRVSPDYFRTMGIRVLRGREFTAHDTPSSPPVAIVNDSFARRFLPKGEALGRFIALPPSYKMPRMQIVGVVADVSFRDLRSSTPYAAYFPLAQDPSEFRGALQMLVRAADSPSAISLAVRRTVHSFNPAIPVTMRTLADEIDSTLTYERLLAMLSAFFGVVALGLAAIGLYGILSYAVTRRTGEIGVRVALGASGVSVVWLVVKQSIALVLIGMAMGCAIALALARYVESLLFGMKPADPVTIAIASAGLVVVTALAAWIPARRATAVDPVQALRYE
jgi:predicted permease